MCLQNVLSYESSRLGRSECIEVYIVRSEKRGPKPITHRLHLPGSCSLGKPELRNAAGSSSCVFSTSRVRFIAIINSLDNFSLFFIFFFFFFLFFSIFLSFFGAPNQRRSVVICTRKLKAAFS